MPCEIFGDRKNGLLKSSGRSSSQTFSSFCHSASRPSVLDASLMTVANAGGVPGAGAAAAGGALAATPAAAAAAAPRRVG